MKILLVDDEPVVHETVRQRFVIGEGASESEAIEVVCAQSLREAGDCLSAAASAPFDAILLDLTLPDAHELVGLYWMRRKYPSTPVIVLTNDDDSSTLQAAMRAGAADYLVKWSPAAVELRRRVEIAVGRSRADIDAQLTPDSDWNDVILNKLTIVLVNLQLLREHTAPSSPDLAFVERADAAAREIAELIDARKRQAL